LPIGGPSTWARSRRRNSPAPGSVTAVRNRRRRHRVDDEHFHTWRSQQNSSRRRGCCRSGDGKLTSGDVCNDWCSTVQLRGPAGAQRPMASSAATAALCRSPRFTLLKQRLTERQPSHTKRSCFSTNAMPNASSELTRHVIVLERIRCLGRSQQGSEARFAMATGRCAS
jgi:hypothetical protein